MRSTMLLLTFTTLCRLSHVCLRSRMYKPRDSRTLSRRIGILPPPNDSSNMSVSMGNQTLHQICSTYALPTPQGQRCSISDRDGRARPEDAGRGRPAWPHAQRTVRRDGRGLREGVGRPRHLARSVHPHHGGRAQGSRDRVPEAPMGPRRDLRRDVLGAVLRER